MEQNTGISEIRTGSRGVDDSVFHLLHDTYMVGMTVLRPGKAVRVVPIEVDDVAGTRLIAVVLPQSPISEPTAADAAGESILFSVADFQAVMLTGTIGAAAVVYQLIQVKPPETGQQINLFGLDDLFRRNIAHLPRRFLFNLNHSVGTGFDYSPHVVHVIGFCFLPRLVDVRQRGSWISAGPWSGHPSVPSPPSAP